MSTQIALFVFQPIELNDLQTQHAQAERKPYVIKKTVPLSEMEYENFIHDFCADRGFIEENADLCSIDTDGVWHCIFVHQRGKKDGVLVMPDGKDYPTWAAYLPKANANIQ